MINGTTYELLRIFLEAIFKFTVAIIEMIIFQGNYANHQRLRDC